MSTVPWVPRASVSYPPAMAGPSALARASRNADSNDDRRGRRGACTTPAPKYGSAARRACIGDTFARIGYDLDEMIRHGLKRGPGQGAGEGPRKKALKGRCALGRPGIIPTEPSASRPSMGGVCGKPRTVWSTQCRGRTGCGHGGGRRGACATAPGAAARMPRRAPEPPAARAALFRSWYARKLALAAGGSTYARAARRAGGGGG